MIHWKGLRRSTKEKIVCFVLVFVMIFGGAIGMFLIEHGQPAGGYIGPGTSSQWTFLNSVYFTVVTLSTIGYGDFVPTTPGAKVWVTFLAIFGIGILVYSLSILTKSFINFAETGIDEIFLKFESIRKGKLSFEEESNRNYNNFILRNGKYFIAFFIYILMIFIGAAVFNSFELWGYGNSIYFCVTTLATIGFGDFAPRTEGGRIFLIFYVCLGFGIFSFLLTEFARSVVAKIERQAETRFKELSENKLTVNNETKSPKNKEHALNNLKDFIEKANYVENEESFITRLEELVKDLKFQYANEPKY